MIVVADASILVVALGDDSQVGQRARDWLVELSGGYDAAYVALLESLMAELLTEGVLATTDRKLAGAPNLSVDVRVFRG